MHVEEKVDYRITAENIVARLEEAWKAMDAAAFAEPFTEDADFVNIRAEHFQGRPAIEAGHAAIFAGIYAGSTTQMRVETARLLRPDVGLAHVRSVLDVPEGPLAGRHAACQHTRASVLAGFTQPAVPAAGPGLSGELPPSRVAAAAP
jgi:uncharacterized protein (TIGR02246 family)